jgi:GNAT superfamily N-acetyltransferase
MTLTIQTVTSASVEDLGKLFSTEQVADACWCMWFIIPVKDYHAAGHAGNRARFSELAAHSKEPMGLLAYQDGEPVGWCAVGPASRYVRAMKTPTYSAGKAGPEAGTWFVPCFFIRKDARGSGVGRALLEAAVRLAQENGATAIEGFPFAGAIKRSNGDIQVGNESLFSACGFEVVRTPSTSRVVMRRALKA